MEIGNNYQNNNRIPKYRHYVQDTTNSNFKRENVYNSINNNISTSLSSYDKNNNEKNLNYYKMKLNRENNIMNSSSRGSRRSRSRSPCLCGCHSNEERINVPEIHCVPVFDYGQSFTQMNSSLISKNEEMNKKNDDLFNEIIYLKRNLRMVENELNRTRTEKDASELYIKELEKELFKLNTDNNLYIENNNNNNINDSKRRLVNSVKMRDYGRYHDMPNKSFEVLDSVSNKCNDPNGKTKGGVNYYYNRDQDYNNVIDSQKKWLDNLPQTNASFRENAPSSTNKYDNKINDNNKLNIFNYPDGYDNTSNFNSKRNSNLPNNFNNINDKGDNSNTNRMSSKSNTGNNSIPNQMTEKTKSIINNNPYDKNNIKKNNFIPMPYPKKINNNINNITNKPNINNQKDTIDSNMKNNNNNNNNINNMNNKNDGEDLKEDEINENEKQQQQYNKLNERILITDKQGNPIFVDGNRVLGMEIMPIIGENGKEEMDDNGNIIFLGPDGQPKTQDDLEPIILDNDKPLVNEENRPFLGINGVAMINKYGNPIIGPGELYDSNNQIVHGELGILPIDNQGNLIKINNNEEPLLNDNDNNNNNNNNINDNENNDENIDDNYNPKKNNKKYSNNNSIPNNNSDINENELKPLIGSDGRPVTDRNNDPIILDKNNKPIKGTGISVLLDQSGMPILNTLGEPILINKEGKPINISDEDDKNIFNIKKRAANYHKIKPNINNRKKNKMERLNENNNNNNKATGKFNYKPFDDENNNKNKNNYVYPKPNPNYQRKNNYKPVTNIKNYERNDDRIFFSNTCFACDVGCGVSRSGYSPMTYSPFDNNVKRRDITPLKDDIEYYEYISK